MTAKCCAADPSKRVDVMLSEENRRLLAQTEQQKHENRAAVATIIDCVRFLAKQGIAYRGHDESATASNRGNFLELLSFLAKYNPSLQKWLDNHPGNASYLSPESQNEFITVLYETTVGVIKSEVADSTYYGIEADEVSDTTGKEFVSVIVRYVVGCEIHERLIGLIRVEDMSGKGLSTIMKDRLELLGLKLTNIVGQCYDGASNMSGQHNGVQAEIKKAAGEKAVYTHCYNHVLALVLEQSASTHPMVVDVFNWLNTAYKFLKHYKVLIVYDKLLDEKKLQGHYKFQSLSQTRWCARSTNLDIAVNAHSVLVAVCEQVMTDGTKAYDAEVKLTAEGLHRKLIDQEFCIALLVMNDMFQKCNVVSNYLQSSAIDLLAAVAAIENLRATLQSCRTDESYATYKKQAADLLLKVKVVQSDPAEGRVDSERLAPVQKRPRRLPLKLCDGQSVLSNYMAFQVPTSTTTSSASEIAASDLKVSFYFMFIDALLQALDVRFSKATCEVLTWMSSFTPKHWHAGNMTFVENLSRLYCIGDKAVRQYEQFCADEGRQSCSNFKALLKYMWDGDFNKVYPDLYTLVKICATVPITSSQCERTHSKVALVKSAIRSSMSDERLEHLVLLNVEQDIVMKLGLSSLVDSFKLAGPSGSRRLKL